MKPVHIETALINLYNCTRKAPLTLEEHDLNRMYLDVLAQALNLKLEWKVQTEEEAAKQEQPKTESLDPNAAVATKKKRNAV